MREIGRLGGLANVKNNGKKHMSKIVKKRWKDAKEKIHESGKGRGLD